MALFYNFKWDTDLSGFDQPVRNMDALLGVALGACDVGDFTDLNQEVAAADPSSLSRDQIKRRKKKLCDERIRLTVNTLQMRLRDAQARQLQLEKINWQLFCDNQNLRQHAQPLSCLDGCDGRAQQGFEPVQMGYPAQELVQPAAAIPAEPDEWWQHALENLSQASAGAS